MKRGHLVALVPALAVMTGTARAEDTDADTEPASVFDVGLDYQRGSYDAESGAMDSSGRTNATYGMSIRVLAPDADKATPLRSIPALWFAAELGWMGASTQRSTGAEEGGGFLLDLHLAGPWTLVNRKRFRAYLGVGFSFGIETGHPSSVDRSSLTADAFAMGLVDIGFEKFGLVVEGEYATGVEYNEQRALALIRIGKLGVGATVVAGQSGTDYHRIGAHVGYGF